MCGRLKIIRSGFLPHELYISLYIYIDFFWSYFVYLDRYHICRVEEYIKRELGGE